MGDKATFMGYGPYEGYDFLREAIVANDYAPLGVKITPDELFVSDGAKSDCGNIGDIFSEDCVVAVCDPVYPVYIDANAMSGRAGDWDGEKWTNIVYMPCTAENGFFPALPERVPDLIYLCFPNNPTGMAATREQLRPWVDYANEHGSVILYDAAYRAYITDPSLPRSIYEIPGAETCAIEFGSFSKTAGFTGTRCGWTVIPRALVRGGVSLYDMWMRRQSTKFNGTAYVIQRAAEATYSPEGKAQIAEMIGYYMENARVIRSGLSAAGLEVYAGRTPRTSGSARHTEPAPGVFRPSAQRSGRRNHPRRGLRPQRRGLHPRDRLRWRGAHPRGRGENKRHTLKIHFIGGSYMKLVIGTQEEACAQAAQRYVNLLNAKPNAVLGLATGSTPLGLYADLAKLCAEGEALLRGLHHLQP